MVIEKDLRLWNVFYTSWNERKNINQKEKLGYYPKNPKQNKREARSKKGNK